MADATLLELEHLQVAYGGIQAVKGIDLRVGAGELVCLIGANGAGKTTTLKGITGLQPVKSGTIRYAGEDITGKPAFELVRKGLSMVPEGRGVFGALSIDENLAMGAYTRSDAAQIRRDFERVFELFPRLKERRKQTAGTLSGGEQHAPLGRFRSLARHRAAARGPGTPGVCVVRGGDAPVQARALGLVRAW